jgi:phosphatidylinositol glycan class W
MWHFCCFRFAFLWEMMTVMISGLLMYTILSDYLAPILVLEVSVMFALVYHIGGSWSQCTLKDIFNIPLPPKSPFLSVIRSSTTMATSIAIIAVDFHIFPRRFAKTETYGAGVMDAGVALYILCHSTVSREAKHPPGDYWTCPSFKTYLRSILTCLKKIIPYIVLWMIRLISIKSTDYQEHISEYGVHWNFFMTLAVVKLMATVLAPLVNIIPHRMSNGIVAIAIGILYQYLLSSWGLREYILYGPDGTYSRDTLISANREGIFSCFGYLSIYFIGVEFGRLFFKSKLLRDYMWLLLYVIILTVTFIGATSMSSIVLEPVSRRLANLTYILWMTSQWCVILIVPLAVDIVVLAYTHINPSSVPISPLYQPLSSQASPFMCLVSAIDYNQFVFFLLANLSTGIINFSIDTLSVGTILSLFILCLHCTCLSIISLILMKLNIKLL